MSILASARVRLLASTIVAFGSHAAYAQAIPLPTGGSVSAGSATIMQQGATTSINQSSAHAVIDWQQFSIGTGGSVNVLQPGSNSALLNRVTGNDVSTISGSLTANGQVFLVNRNGILIDPSGKIDAHGGFIASTLDIKNSDFMAGRLSFSGGGTGSVVNRGTIAGGAVALLGSRVANLGTIVSPMGRVGIGAAQLATLDLNGDGFLQVAIPSEPSGADGMPLIDQSGLIDVGGGLVVMRAATAREIVRQTINMAGIVRATSVSRDGGTVVLDGGDGGTVVVTGKIDASGARGGRIDISGGDVALSGATIAAKGSTRGGLIRVGGAFQGGQPNSATAASLVDTFTMRFGALDPLKAARATTVDAASSMDASGGAAGGTVVVWSEERTRQLGTITATGAVGGAVELSSKGVITTDLLRVTPGRGGSLLLDPKNILIYDTYQFNSGTVADPLTGSVSYAENSGVTSTFNVADIKALIEGGSDVTLRASNDIDWSADLNVGFNVTPGSLSLSAGRGVSLAGELTLNQANLTVLANDTLAHGVVDVDRDPGPGEINTVNARISGGTGSGSSGGNVSLSIANGAGVTNAEAGGMRLSSITARSVSIDAGTGTVSIFDYNGGVDPAVFSAVDGVTLNGAIKIQTSGGLTLIGRSVNWLSEASSALSATSPATQIRFIEDGVLTRYGVLNGGSTGGEGGEGGEGRPVVDTTRLALGAGGTAPAYTATYGDGYGAFTPLHLVSGALQGSDTLGTILTGGTTTSGPAAGQGVGDYSVTTKATPGFALVPGVAGYFVDLRTANDTLRISPKALVATVTAGSYTYGSPDNVASLSGLVGSDIVVLSTMVTGLGVQGLTANSSGYAFAPNLAAGLRTFTLTGLTGAAAANYTLDLTGTISGAVDIARKSLTYAGTSNTSIYGTLNGASFVLAGGLTGDDVSIGLAGISGSGVTSTLTATTNVGTYTTIASALTGAAAANYVIDAAGSSAGKAIINPKTLAYVTSDTSSTYGTLAALTAPTLNGVIVGDDVGVTVRLNDGNVAFSARTAAGNYNINAALTGGGAGNYVLAGLGNSVGVLRVGRLGLSATLSDASMVYSSALPELAVLTGVLAGDDVGTVGTIDNSFGNSTPDAGTHQYQLTGIAGADASNYFLDLTSVHIATLTVTPKPINYSINSQTLTYGSFGNFSVNLLNPSQYPLSASVIVTNVQTGASAAFDPNARLAAGTYTLTASGLTGTSASNYRLATDGNQLGSLLVNPKAVSYSASSVSGTYGNTLHAPFATLNGAFSADDVSANVSILSGASAITLTNRADAGSYVVTVNGISGAAAGNYSLSGGTDGLVTIAQRVLTYRVGDMFTTYGQLAPSNVTMSGILDGDDVTASLLANGEALTNRLDAGSYGVTLGGFGGAQGGNYSVAPGGGSATVYVAKAPLTYTLAAGSSIYGNALNLSPLVWSGMQLGESAPTSYNYLNDSQYYTNVNAGAYTPAVVTNLGGNYYLDTVHSVTGQYTILRRSVALQSVPVSGARGTNYGLVAAEIKGAVNATGTVGSDGVALSVTPVGLTMSSGGYVNVGSYTLKIGAAVGDLYGINYVVGSVAEGVFTVAPLSLNSNGRGYATSIYGTLASLVGAAPALLQGDQVSFTGLGAYKDGQAVTLAPQTAVGDYSVRATGLTGADAANYGFDFSGEVGGLTVAPKALTYDTGNLAATYGTRAALGAATLNGLVGADEVVGLNAIIGGYDARSPVSVRQFDAPTLTGAAASNYTLASGGNFNGYLNIGRKALSVTFLNSAPSSWIYGTAQDLTQIYQLDGVLSGDTVGATVLAQLTGAAAGNPLSIGSFYDLGSVLNAGTYVMSLGSGNGATFLTGASADNYILLADAVTNTSHGFTVTPRTIAGRLTVPSSIVYGDDPKIAVDFQNAVGSGPIGYAVDATRGTTSRALGPITALPANLGVGTQQLGVTLTGLDSFNYLLAGPLVGQTSITPRTVTIDRLADSVLYATSTGAVFGINGMVAGDDVAPMVSFAGGTATRATPVTGGFGIGLVINDVGTYAMGIVSLTGGAAGNYVLAPYASNLAVTPRTITYTSDGFAAQYGGLTLPSCNSGCELSSADNGLAYGNITLNGILASDINLVRGIPLLTIDGRSSAFTYARNTAAGNYLQFTQTLEGSKAGNYVLSQDGSKAGVVVILPAWVRATVTGGGRLYTNAATGTYVTLGTPGLVTIRRSDNIGAAGDSFLAGDRVNVVTRVVDANGNIVDGSGTLQAGSYTINPLLLVGPEAANYRLVPEGGNGSKAGAFTVALPSIFNFSFLSSSPTGYYVPGTISNPPIGPPSTTSTQSTSSTSTSASAGITGGASGGTAGTISTTQAYADGSSISGSAGGSVGAQAGYTPLSATASAAAGGNVSLIINRGPVTINYGAFVDASAKVEVSLKDLTITAGGEVMAGVQEGMNVGGNLGSGMSGNTGVDAKAFATANGEATTSFKNGANIGTSGFIGVGASAGVNGSLTGGGVTGSLAATVYSPGSLYIGAKVESAYADHTLTLGFNLGISLLIGGVELSPKISFSTDKIEAAGSDFANAWVGLTQKMVGVYCDAACTTARAKIQADYDAQVKADTLSAKVGAANQLMISYRTPTLAMINYLQANPDVVHYAQEAQANGTSTPGTNAITNAVGNYQYLTSYLSDVVSQEKALATRIANDPKSITAADLEQATHLRSQEKAVIDSAATMFNMHVVVTNGQLTFG
jgi:filamentous hemagglutinin family protein